MCQLAVSPAWFLRVKAKTALPCLMASLRSASLPERTWLMASKAADEGNLSVGRRQRCSSRGEAPPAPFLSDMAAAAGQGVAGAEGDGAEACEASQDGGEPRDDQSRGGRRERPRLGRACDAKPRPGGEAGLVPRSTQVLATCPLGQASQVLMTARSATPGPRPDCRGAAPEGKSWLSVHYVDRGNVS